MSNSTREGPPFPDWSQSQTCRAADPWHINAPAITAQPAPAGDADKRVGASVKDRVHNWFIRPLQTFGSEDVFVCFMVCLPLIEKRVRFEQENGDAQQVQFSEGSAAIRAAAKLLGTKDVAATFSFWKTFRNGVLHRGMVGPGTPYVLDPRATGSQAIVREDGGRIRVYPLVLRDFVVTMLMNSPSKMWTLDEGSFADVYRA